MPATHFNCKQGIIPFAECIDNWPCSDPCMLPRTLRLASEQREWEGVPSTTQLLQGTRESFLKLVTNYAINPDDRAFAVHGTRVHDKLDQRTGDNELGEERLYDLISSGAFDNYTENGILSDSKTWGSYKVAKALGIYKKDEPVLDYDGQPIRYKSGQKKGEVKTHKVLAFDGRHDRLDVAIQLNDYRMKIEAAGFPVRKMFAEALTRDGGIQVAQQRGLERNSHLIKINHISDRWIERYMSAKWNALKFALDTMTLPPLCRPRETWGGIKCLRYCDVRTKCSALEQGAKLEDVKEVTN